MAHTEDKYGFEGRTEAARANHYWLLRDYQHRSTRPPSDRRRQYPDPAREGYPDTGNGRYAGQAALSGGAAHVHLAGGAGQSRHLLQSGKGHRHGRAERLALYRGHQQPYPQRRPVSGAEGSQEAGRLRKEASRPDQRTSQQARCRHGGLTSRLPTSASGPIPTFASLLG